jgi:predicted ATPase
MSSGTVPPAKRRRFDRNSTIQQPQQSFERTFANGNSRNVYGNIYNAPVTYTGAPVASSELEEDDAQTAERLLEALNFDMREDRLATIGKAHEETCQWLFERDEYKAWRDPDKRHIHHGFFWIKGKPGTGKSTLMKCAYNRGLNDFPNDVIVSFFFNARGAQLQKSTEGMYRSLLCQLLEQMPHLATRLPRRECERLQKPG